MTLINAINIFESLKVKTAKKSEIKVYTQFITILNKLEKREFTSDEIQSIEKELDSLNLKSTSKKQEKILQKRTKQIRELFKGYIFLDF